MKDVDGEVLEDDGGKRHSRKDRVTTAAVDKHDYEPGSQAAKPSGPPPAQREGVEGWINGVGTSGDSVEEIVRKQATKNIAPEEPQPDKGQTTLSKKDASNDDTKRQKTPKELQESQTATRQEDAPSEAWLAQKARYGGHNTSTAKFRRPSDSTEVGELSEKWIWEGLPKEIKTDLDVDDIWKRWRVGLPVS